MKMATIVRRMSIPVGALAAATIWLVAPATARPTAHVAIIGDSISALTSPDYKRELAADHVMVDAVGGTQMADHLATIESLTSLDPASGWDVVVELGTNDAWRHNAGWATAFDEEEAALASQRCVVFVTVNPWLGPIAQAINDAILQAVSTHPNFYAVDWGTIEYRDNAWLQPGDIHPTASGSAELAHLVHDALATYCNVPG